MNSRKLSDIFRECAEKCGLHTYMFARLGEANYRMDEVYQYPVVLRLFNETISETSLAMVRRRRTTLYFCDALGEAEPDTEFDVSPITDEMERRAMEFIDELRRNGITVERITSMTPFINQFDVLSAGVRCEMTFTYKVC